MSTPRAAKRYAKSLFSLAEERGAIEHMENDVRQLQDAISGSHELELLAEKPGGKSGHQREVSWCAFLTIRSASCLWSL
jgi:F0F1-type ATP synthase delta subunit